MVRVGKDNLNKQPGRNIMSEKEKEQKNNHIRSAIEWVLQGQAISNWPADSIAVSASSDCGYCIQDCTDMAIKMGAQA